MDALVELQAWYIGQCNGVWEHSFGVEIGTLDNPGWTLDVDLAETNLSGKAFTERRYGLGSDAETSGHDCFICKVENDKFIARGGPQKLDEMINVFLAWAAGAA